MTSCQLDIRDFPADVQDILKDRAIKEHRPITSVIRDYVLESAHLIIAANEKERSQPA